MFERGGGRIDFGVTGKRGERVFEIEILRLFEPSVKFTSGRFQRFDCKDSR